MLPVVEFSSDVGLWYESDPTLCPFLRYNRRLHRWVALGIEPCPTKLCGMESCFNYGKHFDYRDRLVVIRLGDDPKKDVGICRLCKYYNYGLCMFRGVISECIDICIDFKPRNLFAHVKKVFVRCSRKL